MLQGGKTFTVQKMKFSIKDFFSKYDQILSEKLHFLCSVSTYLIHLTKLYEMLLVLLIYYEM